MRQKYLDVWTELTFDYCGCSVTSKKSPNVYKKLPKNDFTRKMKVFEASTKIA